MPYSLLVTSIQAASDSADQIVAGQTRPKMRSLQKMLGDHNSSEETKFLSVFRKCFSIEEKEKIVGQMLGRSSADILQEMILWLMKSLNPEEQDAIISLWRKVTKNTMFDGWLIEWWEGTCKHSVIYHLGECVIERQFVSCSNKKQNVAKAYISDLVDKSVQAQQMNQNLWQQKWYVTMNQQQLEDTIRRVHRDSSLDSQKKSLVIQYLLTSRWIMVQQHSIPEKKIFCRGQSPSYRDENKSLFGCKHYTQNCKVVTPCCNQIFTCKHCHDEVSDHQVDRKSITKMMCMKCLVIQPIGLSCVSCQYSMAKYYCMICRLFDDDREVYHCPFCNLCRIGKGLGVDYFHCMKCNACLSNSLSEHVCRDKCLEDACPICHEDMFTSRKCVKILHCGHLMHSSCFQDYTESHYTCPVCSKSVGDMKEYFAMLDAFLAEETLPEVYCGQIQAILCNDCGRKGTAPFHQIYHKCRSCGSYNTRVIKLKSRINNFAYYCRM